MSGSESSAPGSGATPEPLAFTVHSLPATGLDETARRTAAGRLKMFLVLAVCAAPVIASYFTYFVLRPQGRGSNYGELITPPQKVPADLPLATLAGEPVAPRSLAGQWLLVVVADAACDATCEKHLWLQRQLRETLGRDKDRVDKVWLIVDDAAPRAQTLDAIRTHTEITVLRVSARELGTWLAPAPGHALPDHLYIVDPLGNWMMRSPPDPEPARLKRDVEKLLRASAGWDKPGR